jgi:hypothetical protein
LKSLKFRRWANILAAILITSVLGFLAASLTDWVSKLASIEYPAEEFGLDVKYPEGFWIYGTGLFIAITISGSLLSLAVRRAVITVDGYDRPTGSIQLQSWAHLVTGLGVALSSLNPAIGPLVFMVGLGCLVVSLQQECPHHPHLLES